MHASSLFIILTFLYKYACTMVFTYKKKRWQTTNYFIFRYVFLPTGPYNK